MDYKYRCFSLTMDEHKMFPKSVKRNLYDMLECLWNSGIPLMSGIGIGITKNPIWIVPWFVSALFRLSVGDDENESSI